MPLHWTIDSKNRRVTVIAEGEVGKQDADEVLDSVGGSNVLGYSKLFDGRNAILKIDESELLQIGVRVREFHAGAVAADVPLGPLAMVVQTSQYEKLARLLGMFAAARRPMKVFEDADAAARWLDSL